MLKKDLLIAFVFLVLCGAAYGQTTVRGYFLKDSVKIGETVPYVLTARYPKELNVLFPDSSYSFAPFEIESKKYFTTHTENNLSYDSVIYSLSSYEIDSIQRLALPVFVMHQKDCTAVDALADSVFLKFIAAEVPDSLTIEKLPLKTNTAYLDVQRLLNYPIILIIVGVLLVTAVAAWISFRKQIKRYFTLKRMKKSHLTFLQRFEESFKELKQNFSSQSAEKTTLIWKSYMEQLSEIPYTKYTTREIRNTLPGSHSNTALIEVDQMVYGGIRLDSLDSFQQLKSEAEDLFRKKIELPKEAVPPANQYTVEEIANLADPLRELPCPVCGQTTLKLNGTITYTVKSFIVLTFAKKRSIIACPPCLNKKNNLAIVSSALLGWWGVPWGLIRTPQYIYLNIKAKRENELNYPNKTLLSYTLLNANKIKASKGDQEKLKMVIRPGNKLTL